jgi:hypothetical protein
MYPIQPTFLQYYQQTINIKFRDVEFKKETDQSTVLECLDTVFSGQYLIADIFDIDRDETFLANIYDYSSGLDIVDLLIDMQFATRP